VNAWLKRCVFNLVLNWDSEPRTISGRLFQSSRAKCEDALPSLVDLELPEASNLVILKTVMDCRVIEGPLNTQELNLLELYRSVVILCD